MVKGSIVSENKRALNEFDYLVRSNTALSIIRKSTANASLMSSVVFSRNYFGLPTTLVGEKTAAVECVSVLTSKGKFYTSKASISDKNSLIGKFKVIVTYAMSGGNKPSSDGRYQVLSSLQILSPNEACTETYLILDTFDTIYEAENLVSYASTKYFRFLLLQALTSIHITKDKFCFVPLQDFSKPWTDEELYAKYGLTDEEIAFIESMIKPMELGGDGDE